MKKLLFFIFLISNLCFANELPDLGDYSETIIGAHEERVIGSQILQQVHQSNSVINDVEIEDYLYSLTNNLVKSSNYSGSGLKFFIVNDRSINAFAMLGGVTMNGETIFSQATEELEKLEEQIQLAFELPINYMIG